MDWVLAGVFLAAAMAVGLVFGSAWSTLRVRPQAVVTPLADHSPPPAVARVSDVELLERVEKLERTFPEWLVAMESMADQARELLDQADRKRRSAVQTEKRFEARQAAPESTNVDEPLPMVAGSIEQQRKSALRAVKARRGW